MTERNVSKLKIFAIDIIAFQIIELAMWHMR